MPDLELSCATQLRAAALAASRRPEVTVAVSVLYDSLADAIELRRPVCRTSGRCCKFDEFGHRLYVTTMEFGAFLRARSDAGSSAARASGGCPFQIDGLCSVHAIRPLGCRVFFCDESTVDWQTEQYERLHTSLRRLHEELDVPYFYVEWRQALGSLVD